MSQNVQGYSDMFQGIDVRPRRRFLDPLASLELVRRVTDGKFLSSDIG